MKMKNKKKKMKKKNKRPSQIWVLFEDVMKMMLNVKKKFEKKMKKQRNKIS